MRERGFFPFSAVVGQERVKRALLLALVNPRAGGLIIAGARGSAKSVLVRSCGPVCRRAVYTLPLNITDDMLWGTFDIEHAVKTGSKRFAPGLLARASGGIIYIDEVNLLRSEILKGVLDARDRGINQVERDGMSYTHTTDFTVIATMDPDEGVLAEPVLDRFGMYVCTERVLDPVARADIMQRVLAFEKDREALLALYEAKENALAAAVAKAQRTLEQVTVSEAMLLLAAKLCAKGMCKGHRAEYYLLQAAVAAAALAGRSYVLPQDIEEAAGFVLPHRMCTPLEPSAPEDETEERTQQAASGDGKECSGCEDDDEGAGNDAARDFDSEDVPQTTEGSTAAACPNGAGSNKKRGKENEKDNSSPNSPANGEDERVDGIETMRMPAIALELKRGKSVRRGSGKRSRTRTALKQGHCVRAEARNQITDIALAATIRAAAPYQKLRRGNGCAVTIRKCDLRQKVREKRIGNIFLFAVDASGSMGARRRMAAVKGAVLQLLEEAYQKRDLVGMLAFRRRQAELLLPPTRSVELAQKCLAVMPTGGKTPLAEGLALALLVLARLKKQMLEPDPVLILLTDGRANSSATGEDPVAEAIRVASKIRQAKIAAVVIDTEAAYLKLGIAAKIASAMGAAYYSLQSISKEDVIRIAANCGGGGLE